MSDRISPPRVRKEGSCESVPQGSRYRALPVPGPGDECSQAVTDGETARLGIERKSGPCPQIHRLDVNCTLRAAKPGPFASGEQQSRLLLRVSHSYIVYVTGRHYTKLSLTFINYSSDPNSARILGRGAAALLVGDSGTACPYRRYRRVPVSFINFPAGCPLRLGRTLFSARYSKGRSSPIDISSLLASITQSNPPGSGRPCLISSQPTAGP